MEAAAKDTAAKDTAATRNEQLEAIEAQVNALALALLKAAAHDVDVGTLPSKHLADYELLRRAEAQR